MTATSADADETKPAGRPAVARKKPPARSRTGNGKTLMAGIDKRTLPYREFSDVVSDLVEHLGGDPSAVEAAIAEEAAGLVVWCRQARRALLEGEKFDVGAYCTATNSLRRLLADIGQERRLRTIVPSLPEYLARKAKTVEGQS